MFQVGRWRGIGIIFVSFGVVALCAQLGCSSPSARGQAVAGGKPSLDVLAEGFATAEIVSIAFEKSLFRPDNVAWVLADPDRPTDLAVALAIVLTRLGDTEYHQATAKHMNSMLDFAASVEAQMANPEDALRTIKVKALDAKVSLEPSIRANSMKRELERNAAVTPQLAGEAKKLASQFVGFKAPGFIAARDALKKQLRDAMANNPDLTSSILEAASVPEDLRRSRSQVTALLKK